MLLEEQSVPGDFPAGNDANVRISISGLAFCRLDAQLSKIFFLRHPKYHDLKLLIYKRKRPADKPQLIETYEFPFDSGITITSDSEPPPDVQAPIDEQHKHLKHLINFRTYHGTSLRPKMPLGIRPPTPLFVRHCRFYTEKMTEGQTFNLIDTATGETVFHNREIGYSLGGLIKCREQGVTLVAINGAEPKLLPRHADGENWLYDVCFTNHCVEEEKCKELIKPGNTDFRFYYDVLEDPKSPNRKFILEEVSRVTYKVGACNVAIDEPAFEKPHPTGDASK